MKPDLVGNKETFRSLSLQMHITTENGNKQTTKQGSTNKMCFSLLPRRILSKKKTLEGKLIEYKKSQDCSYA